MALPSHIQELYASGNVDDLIVDTIELRHDSWTEPAYLTTNPEDLHLHLETGQEVVFVSIPFSMQISDRTTEPQQSIQIGISNVSRSLATFIEQAFNVDTPVSVIYRGYAPLDSSAPSEGPYKLTTTSMSMDNTFIKFSATKQDLTTAPFPSNVYTTTRFPGLYR
jgi:hypothetical protein